MNFPTHVRGWLTEVEGHALAELATGKVVLEVGSYCGRSTICMAQTADRVCSVDPFTSRATPGGVDTYDEFVANLNAHLVSDKVFIVRDLFTEESAKQLPVAKFGLIFIDGDHSYEAVWRDFENAKTLLDEDGLIAFHDYRLFPGEHDGNYDAGVTKAVGEILAAGSELVARHGTIAVVRPARESAVLV